MQRAEVNFNYDMKCVQPVDAMVVHRNSQCLASGDMKCLSARERIGQPAGGGQFWMSCVQLGQVSYPQVDPCPPGDISLPK